jgi:hypothetical protein
MKNLWVVYDERAMTTDIFDCSVLESCSSEHEAMNKALPGIVFKYDINKKNELINKQKLGPNNPMLKEWKKNESK